MKSVCEKNFKRERGINICRTRFGSFFGSFSAFFTPFSEGPKGGRRKGGRGRKLSHFSFCCAFRCCVVYSPCFPVWGEEKVMTIYDAGPLAAGPLCGLLTFSYRFRVLFGGSFVLQTCRSNKMVSLSLKELGVVLPHLSARKLGRQTSAISMDSPPASHGCSSATKKGGFSKGSFCRFQCRAQED